MQEMNDIDNGNFFGAWMQELLWPSSSEDHGDTQQQNPLEQVEVSTPSPCASCDSETTLWPADHLHNFHLQSHSQQSSRVNNPTKAKNMFNSRMRQPKVALATRSDIDILDDGYKWRKYGQKSVKNSKHPRSYYRCSMVGCPVKKRVERSTLDPTLVVTTYHNIHNHHTPTPMNTDLFGLPKLD